MHMIDLLFGCRHKHLSFPRSVKPRAWKPEQRRASGAPAGTYVVCLDCGQEFEYDWQQMRMLTARERRARDHARAAIEVPSTPSA